MKSLGNFPDPFIAEIAGQPDALRRAGDGVVAQRATLVALEDLRDHTLVFSGMGSSYHACYPATNDLARAGIAAVMLDSAELLHFRRGILNAGVLLVAVSQSGESAEVVRLAEELRVAPAGPTILSVTNGIDNTLASLADLSLHTHAGEESGPSTMTFAASLVVMHAIAEVLRGRPPHESANHVSREAGLAAAAIERLLAARSLPDELADWLGDRDTVVILGRGPARAAAEMGALTLKEAVGLPVESLETAQFRHGPLELAGPDLAAIVLATEAETLDLDVGLAAELIEARAAVLLVTADAGGPPGAMHIEIGPLDRALAPAVSILPIQLLAWRLANLRGREPGAYTLARKVTTRE